MKTFYLTFGTVHPLRNGWIEIEADCKDSARKKAIQMFGLKWSFLNSEEEMNFNFFPQGRFGQKIK